MFYNISLQEDISSYLSFYRKLSDFFFVKVISLIEVRAFILLDFRQ